MATNFGKLNFAVSFNPQTAFPLDARCYFENLNDAIAAAASAEAAGSTTTTYYYGQTLVVVDFTSKTTQLYVIQQDNTLKALGQGELDQEALLVMLKAVLVDKDGNALIGSDNKLQLKTINGTSIIGSGDIIISENGIVDLELNDTSENAIANKIVKAAIDDVNKKYTICDTVSDRDAIQASSRFPGMLVYVVDPDVLYRWTGSAWVQLLDQSMFVRLITSIDGMFSQVFNSDHFTIINSKVSLNLSSNVADGEEKAISSNAVFDYVEEKIGVIEDVLSDI